MLAVEGCEIVIHNGHPNPIVHKRAFTDEEMVEPAEKGMKNILNACEKHNVTKLIVTVGLVACIGDLFKNEKGEVVYNE